MELQRKGPLSRVCTSPTLGLISSTILVQGLPSFDLSIYPCLLFPHLVFHRQSSSDCSRATPIGGLQFSALPKQRNHRSHSAFSSRLLRIFRKHLPLSCPPRACQWVLLLVYARDSLPQTCESFGPARGKRQSYLGRLLPCRVANLARTNCR